MLGRILGLAPALLLLTVPLGGAAQTVEPNRLDGTFLFDDDDQGINNTLDFVLEGDRASASGEVFGVAGPDLVRIRYTTIFPSDLSAKGNGATIGQRDQVLIELEVAPGEGSGTTPYLGFAAPNNCRAQARVRGSKVPNRSDAQLKCDLGNGLQRLDDDDNPDTPGDPPEDVLEAVDQAFAARKDVKVKVGGGKLMIKHKGSIVIE